MAYEPGLHTASNKPYATIGGPDLGRYMFYDENTFMYRPYSSLNEVFSYLDTVASREGKPTVLVSVSGVLTEYWFRDGTDEPDLIEKIPDVNLSNYYTKGQLQTSGQSQVNYDNLINVPATTVSWEDITGDQSSIGNSGFTNNANYITISDVPDQVQVDWNAVSGISSILNKPSLADVAISGDYNDLINKPSSSYAFENGLRESGGVVKLGLDLTTIGTTNKGLLTEDTYLLKGDLTTGMISGLAISDMTVSLEVRSQPYTYFQIRGDVDAGDCWIRKSINNNQDSLQQIIFSTYAEGNLIKIDDVINHKGLEEGGDYSANKTEYSYVTKKMLDEAPIRLSKTISTTTYTLISGDEKRWLIFTNVAGCTITIPNSVFADGQGLQGVQRGAGQLTFTAGSGVTLNKSSLSNAKTAVINSVFGIQFESASVCTLFGELELI